MDFNASIDELLKRNEAKSQARKLKTRERKREDKGNIEESQKSTEGAISSEKQRKKKKYSRAESVAILDKAVAFEESELPRIEEKELKEVLKIVVKIMNTIPYEHMKVLNFEEDADPHRKAKGETHLRKRDRSQRKHTNPSQDQKKKHKRE